MNKYTSLIILIAVFLIAGCSDYPTDEQFVEARNWCDDFGGTKITDFSGMNGLRVICLDGTMIIKMYGN